MEKEIKKCKYGHAWRIRGWQEEKDNKDRLIRIILRCEECGWQTDVKDKDYKE